MIRSHFSSQGVVSNLKVVENREFRAALRCIYLECETKELQDILLTQ
jgi:hypothetical protein